VCFQPCLPFGAMFACSATSVPLRADDLHEYETAKRTWKRVDKAAGSQQEQAQQQSQQQAQQAARKQEVRSRIGAK